MSAPITEHDKVFAKSMVANAMLSGPIETELGNGESDGQPEWVEDGSPFRGIMIAGIPAALLWACIGWYVFSRS
jgi:hypothetical protein